MKKPALALCLLLAACGSRQELRPPPGHSLPVQPEESSKTLTVRDMLTVSPSARPNRVDEVLTRSQEREEDRFDLPPPE